MKVYVNNHGWIMGIQRENGEITGIRYTSHREGAKPFRGDWPEDEEALDALRFVEAAGCAYFKYKA